MLRRLLLPLLVLLLLPVPAAAQKRIALSFDDAPGDRGPFFTTEERTERIIRELREAAAPQAVFFVVPGAIGRGDGIGGDRRIQAYVDAGHVIANHSNTHPPLSEIEADAYLADIDAAEGWLKGRPAYRPWFRFPFLDEGGQDRSKRDAIRSGLTARGLRNGYVTADAWDWHLENLSREAMQADKPVDRTALRDLYLRWRVEAADFADAMMQQLVGRQPVQVMLLHETDVTALYVGDLVRALRASGWTVVSADEAYADPIGALVPDAPTAGGTLVEAIAAERGLSGPRRYHYNDIERGADLYHMAVLGEGVGQ
ncbi:MAG: polysaccharide deacetylase family protein [Sphingopyxis sp.]|uniref:polysaccharide deacetylase family protein n=1 Tax=Sphingopyxis sp. TaxID=1908224 RepID=UPI002ABC8F43|nr:polysaccharide deacetylase family protein [Sphingopyxis sp.]MDZ3831819.1 polysaccharide deacetylase family protein [Sphingopyxis sp.]